jgi:hypothetical protein
MKQIVIIEWRDSLQPRGGWISLDEVEAAAPPLMTSVGWLYKETEDVAVVVPHYFDGKHPVAKPQCMGELTIPKCCTKSIRQVYP